jgi:serine/threonine-protein kinase
MIGERLGKWIISKELGRGGMGRVYLGQEEIGGRQAALKILSPELAQEVGFLQRFQREIAILAQLQHPNIVRLYESGLEDGHYYYAMEYVEGQSFEELLHAQGRLPWSEVLDAALQMCSALKHAHDHGIIHRDLKPPNILRTAAGEVKLTDFGIAKVFASSHLTATGGIVGTAEYLSPEQAAGKPVSKRSDLYSLGVVLYTLLTGRTPFEGTSFLDLLHKHRFAQFDPPQKVVPDIPYELDEIVCQLLQKDPAQRPADGMVLGRQLESIRRKLQRKGHLTHAAVRKDQTFSENRDPEEGESGPGAATLMSRLMREELERQNRGSPLDQLFNRVWVILPLFALVVGVLVWTFFLRETEDATPPDPSTLEKPSEAQRFYQRGLRLKKEGDPVAAQNVWKNLVRVFQGVESEKVWVEKAQKGRSALADQVLPDKERWAPVRAALAQARKLYADGQKQQAREIWDGIEELYQDDPSAREILQEVRKDRKE